MKRRRAPEAQSAGRGKAALARVGPALVRRGHHAGAGICSLRDCGLEAMHPQGQKEAEESCGPNGESRCRRQASLAEPASGTGKNLRSSLLPRGRTIYVLSGAEGFRLSRRLAA